MASTSVNGASRKDKLSTALEYKSTANSAFVAGDVSSALKSYHLALLYLSGLETRSILGLVGENSGQHGRPEDLSSDDEEADADADEPTAEVNEQKLSQTIASELSKVYSNMSACYLKQSLYTKAITAAEKAIKTDSKNLKAKFRKAQAMRLAGDVYKAQSFLNQTIQALNASSSKKGKEGEGEDGVVAEFERELKAVEKTIAAKEAEGRNVWKGFLGKKEATS